MGVMQHRHGLGFSIARSAVTYETRRDVGVVNTTRVQGNVFKYAQQQDRLGVSTTSRIQSRGNRSMTLVTHQTWKVVSF